MGYYHLKRFGRFNLFVIELTYWYPILGLSYNNIEPQFQFSFLEFILGNALSFNQTQRRSTCLLPIKLELLKMETKGHSKISGIKLPSVQMCSVKFSLAVQLMVIFSSLLKSTLIGAIVDPVPASPP